MIYEFEIREHLALLLLGQMSIRQFEEWLAQRSLDMHLDTPVEVQDLVASIELAMAEHGAGHRSRGELWRELESLLGAVEVSVRIGDASSETPFHQPPPSGITPSDPTLAQTFSLRV